MEVDITHCCTVNVPLEIKSEATPDRQVSNQQPATTTASNIHHTSSTDRDPLEPKVFLGICQVTVESRGRLQKARALLDSGSHMSFMTSRLAQQLKVEKIREPTHLTGIAQTAVPGCNFKAELSLVPDKR